MFEKCSKKSKLPFGARCDLITKNVYDYKSAFTQSDFCLITKSERIFQINLIEALAANCIPIISTDNVVLPFSEVKYFILKYFASIFDNFFFFRLLTGLWL